MERSIFSRKGFIGATGAGVLGGLPAVAGASTSAPTLDDRLDAALVLSGGGARGAYEAGVIGALVAQLGIKDGQRLPGADLVAGASIGALNGWFVATGQYSQLAEVWRKIGSENILRPKPQFAQLDDSSSGVLTRVYEALSLERGLITNARGVVDEKPIRDWIARSIDPSVPLLVPYLLTVTNLTLQQRELFYRSPDAVSNEQLHGVQRTLAFLSGRKVPVRKMLAEEIRDSILASAAIPVVFDPIRFQTPDGQQHEYVDGGVANPAPFDFARAIAKRINVVLLDPFNKPTVNPQSALQIGLESFGITQSRVRLTALRDAAVDTAIKRTFSKRPDLTAEEKALLDRIPDADMYQLRPEKDLPADVADFNKQDLINETYTIGFQDGLTGWQPVKLDL